MSVALHATLNSRYIGNLLSVLLNENRIVRTVLMGASVWFLVWLISTCITKLSGNEDRHLFVFQYASLMLFTMDRHIWAQTIGWVSGFANYGFAAICVLLDVLILYSMQERQSVIPQTYTKRVFLFAGLFLFGLASMLFLENISVLLLLCDSVALVALSIKVKSINKQMIMLFLGNLIGAAVMFSNKIFSELLSTGVALSELPGSAGRKFVFEMDDSVPIKLGKIKDASSTILEALVDYCLPCLIFTLVLGIVSVYICKSEKRKINKWMLFLPAMALFSIVPFMVIEAWGSRSFFHAEILLIVVIGVLMLEALSYVSKYFSYAMILVSLSCAVYVGMISNAYYRIGQVDRERNMIIRNCATKEILLPSYDNVERTYLHTTDYGEDNKVLDKAYRDYYGIPECVIIKYSEN